MNNIGERIKENRIALNLTQYDLAKSLGIAVSTISMYETGERVPSDTMKIKLANIFKTTVGALFFDENDTLSKQTIKQ